MAGGAKVVHLRGCEVLGTDDLDVLRRGAVDGGFHRADVLFRRAVTRFAANARLGPGRVVGVGCQVVVCGKLGDVTIKTGGVEGEHAVGPIEGRIAAIEEMPHAAGRHVVPGPLVDVVRQRQHLQAAAIQRGEEVIDVLAAHHLRDRVCAFAAWGDFAHAAGRRGDLDVVPAFTDRNIARLRRQPRLGKRRGIRLHGQAVPGSGPELVELRVALLTSLGAGQSRGRHVRRGRRLRCRRRGRLLFAAARQE